MSETFSEFCRNGKVRSYACGSKGGRGMKRLLSAAVVALMVRGGCSLAGDPSRVTEGQTKDRLQAESFMTHNVTEQGDTLLSYRFKGNAAHMERIQDLVTRAVSTPTGASILSEAARNDCVIMMEPIGLSTAGFYAPGLNLICLNSLMSDAALLSTLIHEGRHACQSYGSEYQISDPSYDRASLITLARAMEADAMSAQAAFSHELKERGDSEAWQKLRSSHRGITDAFEAAALKHGTDSHEARRAAMLAWYDDKGYVKLYENQYAAALKRTVEAVSPEQLALMATQSIPADSIVSQICRADGVRYFGKDGSVLETPETYYIRSGTLSKLEDVDKKFREKTGQVLGRERSDSSHLTFYVVPAAGPVREPSLRRGKNGAVKTAVLPAVRRNVSPGRGF